jgi:hypothetical protein
MTKNQKIQKVIYFSLLLLIIIFKFQNINDSINTGRKKKTLNKYGVKPGGIGSLFAGGKFPPLKKRSLENSSVPEEKNVIASAPVLKKTSLPSVSVLNS